METMPERQTWDEEVSARLNAHIESERDVLAEYAAAVEKIDAPDVRYLIQLILDDERRHHRTLREIARAVRAAQEWHHRKPQIPDMNREALPEAMRTLTTRLLAVEREDERELKALRRQLQPVADTTLWALLVDLMALDTEKHERILGFIIDHADR